LKVLGIAASPRRGGNTDLLLAEVMHGAASKGADIQTIFLSELNIAPCQHCDDCFQAGECKIDDDMQLIYRELVATNRIVLASPIHFMGVTAQAKAMIDRCQALWAKKYKLDLPPLGDRLSRKGLFISVGGRSVDNLFEPALVTVKALFNSLDINYSGKLIFSGIDERGAITSHPKAFKQAYLAGQKLAED
jgi:NAD(P)H-dependent FMN reductase